MTPRTVLPVLAAALALSSACGGGGGGGTGGGKAATTSATSASGAGGGATTGAMCTHGNECPLVECPDGSTQQACVQGACVVDKKELCGDASASSGASSSGAGGSTPTCPASCAEAIAEGPNATCPADGCAPGQLAALDAYEQCFAGLSACGGQSICNHDDGCSSAITGDSACSMAYVACANDQ